jgi:hypothetical protein
MAAACVILFGSLAVPNGREAFIYFQF